MDSPQLIQSPPLGTVPRASAGMFQSGNNEPVEQQWILRRVIATLRRAISSNRREEEPPAQSVDLLSLNDLGGDFEVVLPPTREVDIREVATQEAQSQVAITQEADSLETENQDVKSQELEAQEPIVSEPVPQEIVTQAVPTEELALQETTVQDPAPQEAVPQEIVIQEATNEEVTAEQTEPSTETPKEQNYYCCLCFEKFDQSALISVCKTSPQDLWCGGCIERAFQRAVEDRECMPAKCHSIIQLQYAAPFISEETAANYKDRFDLWSTKNRVYCPVPSCSAFIKPRLIDAAQDKKSESYGKLECPECHIPLCVKCQEVDHPDQECPSGEIDPEIMEALTRWGYKRCPKCGEAVRRMYGCRHMRCLCGASWCWACLLPIDECDQECDNTTETEEEDIIEAEPWAEMLEEGVELPMLFSEAYIRDTPLPDIETPPPRPRLRRQRSNLDALPANYWHAQGLNFGDEPTNNQSDHVWCCSHNFGSIPPANAGKEDTVSDDIKDNKVYCHRCWDLCEPTSAKECNTCWLVCCLSCVQHYKPSEE